MKNTDASVDFRSKRFRVHLMKVPGGGFEVTVDGFPDLECCALSSDEALLMTAKGLERLENEGVSVPDRGIYTWEEYVSLGLCPMGKMVFSDLPTGQRFLRKGYPTMWDKITSTEGWPLASPIVELTVIPADELVWHHVWTGSAMVGKFKPPLLDASDVRASSDAEFKPLMKGVPVSGKLQSQFESVVSSVAAASALPLGVCRTCSAPEVWDG